MIIITYYNCISSNDEMAEITVNSKKYNIASDFK